MFFAHFSNPHQQRDTQQGQLPQRRIALWPGTCKNHCVCAITGRSSSIQSVVWNVQECNSHERNSREFTRESVKRHALIKNVAAGPWRSGPRKCAPVGLDRGKCTSVRNRYRRGLDTLSAATGLARILACKTCKGRRCIVSGVVGASECGNTRPRVRDRTVEGLAFGIACSYCRIPHARPFKIKVFRVR